MAKRNGSRPAPGRSGRRAEPLFELPAGEAEASQKLLVMIEVDRVRQSFSGLFDPVTMSHPPQEVQRDIARA